MQYTNIENDVINFPFYMIVGSEDEPGDVTGELEREVAPSCPVYHRIADYYRAPEFRVSSAEDLAEVAWFGVRVAFLGGGSLTDEDYLEIGRCTLVDGLACTLPNGEAGSGEPLTIEGDLLEEAMTILEGLLQTRTLG